MAGIKLLLDEEKKEILEAVPEKKKKTPANLTDEELRGILKNELNEAGRYGKASMRQGELARFFVKR